MRESTLTLSLVLSFNQSGLRYLGLFKLLLLSFSSHALLFNTLSFFPLWCNNYWLLFIKSVVVVVSVFIQYQVCFICQIVVIINVLLLTIYSCISIYLVKYLLNIYSSNELLFWCLVLLPLLHGDIFIK